MQPNCKPKGVLSNDSGNGHAGICATSCSRYRNEQRAANANKTVEDLRFASQGVRANLDDPEAPVGMLLKDTLLADAFKETI